MVFNLSRYGINKRSKPDYTSNGEFWRVFLVKHPDGVKKSDELSRWWLALYKYTKYKRLMSSLMVIVSISDLQLTHVALNLFGGPPFCYFLMIMLSH